MKYKKITENTGDKANDFKEFASRDYLNLVKPRRLDSDQRTLDYCIKSLITLSVLKKANTNMVMMVNELLSNVNTCERLVKVDDFSRKESAAALLKLIKMGLVKRVNALNIITEKGIAILSSLKSFYPRSLLSWIRDREKTGIKEHARVEMLLYSYRPFWGEEVPECSHALYKEKAIEEFIARLTEEGIE